MYGTKYFMLYPTALYDKNTKHLLQNACPVYLEKFTLKFLSSQISLELNKSTNPI